MWLKAFTIFVVSVALCDSHGNNPNPPSPVPTAPVEPEWKAPEEYLKIRRHDVNFRDHGCAEFPEKIEKTYHCVDIWIKNKFSESDPASSPTQFFTEFQYHEESKKSWKPVVTWVENINPWRVRACAASTGGEKGALENGKMRWFALYSLPQSTTEQSGTLQYGSPGLQALTSGKHCFNVNFPASFAAVPTIKLQWKLKNGLHSAHEAMVIWAKGLTQNSMQVCLEEFYAWSRYHHEYEIYWYGVSAAHVQDQYSRHMKVMFNAGDLYPTDHKDLNSFYCKEIDIPKLYPCPAVLLQPVEPSSSVCESTIVAWIAGYKDDHAMICYHDKRGIMHKRKTDVEVHVIMYGYVDPCNALTCPSNKICIHPEWNKAECGCIQECPDGGEEACGTNMKTYENRCHLDKAACESGFKFSYAHHSKCEKYTMDHGREQLVAESGCDGMYCKQISTGPNVWYKDAHINVQVTVNWMSEINSDMPTTHDASSSWVENVTPNGFKACVMDAGRRSLVTPPSINWFAFQGKVPHVKSHRMEVGEWRSGTHCAPIHERTVLEKPMEFHPPSCPSTDLRDSHNHDHDQWHYDSHVMSEIFGQHQHEWMQRMMAGYGVKKMNLTSGMELMNATLMMTVETTEAKVRSSRQDAVNVWMEYDAATKEAYVCLREMTNWDGLHKGIHVHWTLFNHSMIPEVGFSHQVMFKPHYMAPMYNNYAFCETKQYLPANFSLIDSATVLVSLQHRIPAHSAFDSMKKYKLYQQEVLKGMPMGDLDFNKKEVQASWMLPHMWRANLSGWRPHMRINKNSDYSAWIEGMNGTHLRVCQKSLFTGFHYEGVRVSLFVLPDRCPKGSSYLNSGMCGVVSASCATSVAAGQACQSESKGFLGAPENPRDNYWVSYLANQSPIWLAKTDADEEGKFKRAYGNPSMSNYSRWAKDEPMSDANLDCVLQGGLLSDFSESVKSCSECHKYVCVNSAPSLSCNFGDKDYCMNDGKCHYDGPMKMSCQCKPPYMGDRCQTKMAVVG